MGSPLQTTRGKISYGYLSAFKHKASTTLPRLFRRGQNLSLLRSKMKYQVTRSAGSRLMELEDKPDNKHNKKAAQLHDLMFILKATLDFWHLTHNKLIHFWTANKTTQDQNVFWMTKEEIQVKFSKYWPPIFSFLLKRVHHNLAHCRTRLHENSQTP